MSRNQERGYRKLIVMTLVICLVLTGLPVFSHAASGKDKPKLTKVASKVQVSRTDKIASKWGGHVTGIKTAQLKGNVTVDYGKTKKFTIKTYSGYYLLRVLVDGKSVGRKKSLTIKGDGEDHKIVAEYAKADLMIKVDPGHAGYYNKGAVSGFWESIQMWKLSNYIVPFLNEYPGINATMTKERLYDDPLVYERGRMAKGNDLFISIHSNSSSSKSTDYPLTIVSSAKKQLYNVAQPLGKKIAAQVKKTMKTRQKYQVWVKKQKDGRDWYGVIRGSSDVNVPGIIVEHSFHSNKKMANWLMKNANLKKMAEDEAKVIATYYGFLPDGGLVKPEMPEDFTVKSSKENVVSVSWKKAPVTGYEVFRATKENGKYTKITSTTARSFKHENLKSGKTYYYKIRSYRCNGKKIVYSPYSEIKMVVVK